MAGLCIGVNALYLIPGGVGGTEIYLRSLLRALAAIDDQNQYVVFTNEETGGDLVPEARNFHWSPQQVQAVNRPARIFWEQCRLPASIRRERLDVVLNPGFTAPLWCDAPQVSVFHDLQHKRRPELFRWFDLPFWRFFLWQAARSSRRLIAVSQATADDLAHYYPRTARKVRVVRHGVDERLREIAAERRQRTPEPFVLCVSTLHPHKNICRLLRAFAEYQKGWPRWSLVLAGMKGFHANRVERLRRELGLAESVIVTGWIPREEIYDLYRRASAFIYPSTFEGFGMPVLEALAAGVPTACANIAPLREVAGMAAVYFDPLDVEAIFARLLDITQDGELRQCLSRDGPERAARFSWEKAAWETLETLREAVAT